MSLVEHLSEGLEVDVCEFFLMCLLYLLMFFYVCVTLLMFFLRVCDFVGVFVYVCLTLLMFFSSGRAQSDWLHISNHWGKLRSC